MPNGSKPTKRKGEKVSQPDCHYEGSGFGGRDAREFPLHKEKAFKFSREFLGGAIGIEGAF